MALGVVEPLTDALRLVEEAFHHLWSTQQQVQLARANDDIALTDLASSLVETTAAIWRIMAVRWERLQHAIPL